MTNTNPFKKAAEEAANATNEHFSSIISNLTNLTEQKIGELFPERADKENLLELLTLINSDTEENNKVDKFIQNSEKFGKIVLRLVKTLI